MFDYAKISCRERQLKITSVDWTKPYKTAVPFIHLCDKSNDLSIHVQRVVRGGEDGCEGFLEVLVLLVRLIIANMGIQNKRFPQFISHRVQFCSGSIQSPSGNG